MGLDHRVQEELDLESPSICGGGIEIPREILLDPRRESLYLARGS
jgi:hypothetical protein